MDVASNSHGLRCATYPNTSGGISQDTRPSKRYSQWRSHHRGFGSKGSVSPVSRGTVLARHVIEPHVNSEKACEIILQEHHASWRPPGAYGRIFALAPNFPHHPMQWSQHANCLRRAQERVAQTGAGVFPGTRLRPTRQASAGPV